MKRFFPVLLAVLLVVFSAVPVMASDYSYNDVVLPDINDLPYFQEKALICQESNGSYLLIFLGENSDIYYTDTYNAVAIKVNSDYYSTYSYVSDAWSFVYTDSSDNLLHSLNGCVIVWSSFDIYHKENGSLYFSASDALPVLCDGTACSATDLNFDDLCDDCGLMLVEELRVSPTVIEIVVKHSDALTLRYVYTETLADTSFGAVYADDAITVSFDNPVNHVQYQLVDGEWVEYASSATVSSSHNISFVDPASIVSSDLNIYDASGNLFFGPPSPILPGRLEGVKMTEVLMEIVRILPIVLVCLVGWIGLRKGLALLVRLLRKA